MQILVQDLMESTFFDGWIPVGQAGGGVGGWVGGWIDRTADGLIKDSLFIINLF